MGIDLEELRPRRRRTVMSLVAAAGVDVSDWARFGGGARRAAANPRYCFEWAFLERGRVAVISLWFHQLELIGDRVVCRVDAIRRAKRLQTEANVPGVLPRARKLVQVLLEAQRDRLPIRVILVTGQHRGFDPDLATRSEVRARDLDPVPWAIIDREHESEDWILERGAAAVRVEDQFAAQERTTGSAAEVRTRTGRVRVRNASLRLEIASRSAGRCEYCGAIGFCTSSGARYIEVHHIVSLADDGPDTADNMIALCPLHHREAHHGENRDRMREALERIARERTASDR